MQIEVRGRGISVSEELREAVQRRFEKVSRQVNPLAVLQVEFSHHGCARAQHAVHRRDYKSGRIPFQQEGARAIQVGRKVQEITAQELVLEHGPPGTTARAQQPCNRLEDLVGPGSLLVPRHEDVAHGSAADEHAGCQAPAE